ncbi:hypothetical protein NS184_00165 [Curtobacterium luteum]|uniref:Uncharacterized protein n=2 Tax=Curtobacterium luteum TaxID=33881 RepID=A0A147DBT5_9MICO|nr:hypothetical protein NS184_00165 [Curtobacterium luteum]
MGERDEQAPSALRLVGMLAALVLLLGGVVTAVVLSAGTAVHRALGPQETEDGSICEPLNGECSRLGRTSIEKRFSVRLPTDAQLEASGARSLIKASESWAVACVPDVSALLRDAERAGFVESAVSDHPERHDWSGKGPVSREVRLTAPAEAARWVDVGSSCDVGTWVYLGSFLDK